MGTAERRKEIMRELCRRRHDTITNLASEFGVSERTMRRDIEALSLSEPIYTQTGKYGGVYVTDGYFMDRMYMAEDQILVLHKLLAMAETQGADTITAKDCELLRCLITEYTKPARPVQKGENP